MKQKIPVLLILALLCLFGPAALAENNQTVIITNPDPYLNRPERIKVFDDRVFDLDNRGATTTRTLYGGERYLGDRASYSSEQQKNAEAACEAFRRQDMRRFRECFVEKVKAR